MKLSWAAAGLVTAGLFLVGGAISFARQGIKLGAGVLTLGAALSIVAGVLWW